MRLVSLDDPNTVIAIGCEILLIGRAPECDVVFRSTKISRQHCCLARVHDHLVVRDLGSTNGIQINGERCDEGRLTTGDILAIADIRFRLEERPAAKASSAPSTKNDSAEEFAVPEPGSSPVPKAPTQTLPTFPVSESLGDDEITHVVPDNRDDAN